MIILMSFVAVISFIIGAIAVEFWNLRRKEEMKNKENIDRFQKVVEEDELFFIQNQIWTTSGTILFRNTGDVRFSGNNYLFYSLLSPRERSRVDKIWMRVAREGKFGPQIPESLARQFAEECESLMRG